MGNEWLQFKMRHFFLTCTSKHYGAPPNGPAPSHEAEEHAEELRYGHDNVDDEGSDSCTSAVELRETRNAHAEAKESGEQCSWFTKS